MSSKKSILFFCSFPPPFTGQRVATKLIFDLLGDHANLDFVNLSASQETIKRTGSLKLFFIYVKRYLQLIKKLKKNRYDYVYVVFAPSKFALLKDYISASIINRCHSGLLIAHLHCGNYGDNFQTIFFKRLFGRLIKKVDSFIFLSPVLNKIPIIPASKVFYLNNTISAEIICTDDEVNKKIASKKDRKNLDIFYISNMIREKGYEDLITAAGILHKKGNIDFKVHLVGSWPGEAERKNFEERLHIMGLQEKVIIYGPVNDREQIKKYFIKADIFVLPTYYSVEAQPLSIIEAFNAGTPVISTIHAAIPDMISNGLNGYLVAKHAPDEIACNIAELVSFDTWKQMALQAREKYVDFYADNIFFQKLIVFFKLNSAIQKE